MEPHLTAVYYIPILYHRGNIIEQVVSYVGRKILEMRGQKRGFFSAACIIKYTQFIVGNSERH